MEFGDKTLKWVNCAEEFVFGAAEQRFFSMKQFQNEPNAAGDAEETRTRAPSSRNQRICAECGIPTVVPFNPSQGRPVLCRACFDHFRVALDEQIGLKLVSSRVPRRILVITQRNHPRPSHP
jgi:CxxC-x17-CxxC domain-containing protein